MYCSDKTAIQMHSKTRVFSTRKAKLCLIGVYFALALGLSGCGDESVDVEDYDYYGQLSAVHANDGAWYLFLKTSDTEYGLLYDDDTKYVNMDRLGDQVRWTTGGFYGINGEIEEIDGKEYINCQTVAYVE